MKIPDSVRIAGVEYPISYVDNLRHGNLIALGHISYEECKITLSATDGIAHESRCQTIWHEIIHCILDNVEEELSQNERVVNIIAKGIYQVLQDNGKRLYDLEKENANGDET